MVAATRSQRVLTSSLKASKGGVSKRAKATSSAAKQTRKSPLSKKIVANDGSATPVPAKAMASPYPNGAVPHAPASRPASPTATNAPLVSPPASATVLSYGSAPTTTTADMLQQGIAHILKVEPKFAPLVEKYECTVFAKEGLAETVDPFHSLISGIISQQVSGAAAGSIKAKFIALFSEEMEEQGLSFPTPEMVLKCDQTTLRTAGLSTRKAEYVHSLSEKFISGDLSVDILSNASNEEVVERLVQVRGIGVWSAEMFLMFGLKRMDVFSLSDLGIQRGQAVIAGRDVDKLKTSGKGKWKYMSEGDMIEHSKPFSPYRSLYMWYLWKASDVSVESFKAGAVAKKVPKKAPKKGKKKAEE